LSSARAALSAGGGTTGFSGLIGSMALERPPTKKNVKEKPNKVFHFRFGPLWWSKSEIKEWFWFWCFWT
jgi:hypothetical protein